MSNNLSNEKRAQMLMCLVEGMSLRATNRVCGVAFNTALSFVPMLGKACSEYQDRTLRNLTCERLELDEQHGFYRCRQKNLVQGRNDGGDVWSWLALDSETKLVVSYFCGDRSISSAFLFLQDIRQRVANEPTIVTDGLAAYVAAVENSFGSGVDFAQLVKVFGPSGALTPTGRYAPPKLTTLKRNVISGHVEEGEISTSYVERLNLTVRMGNRRCTRLTNAHSKTLENHVHMMGIFFMFYNFCRIHQSLRITPAMAAGVTDHVWEASDVVALLAESDRVSDAA